MIYIKYLVCLNFNTIMYEYSCKTSYINCEIYKIVKVCNI